MICKSCNSETSSELTMYKDGQRYIGCKHCITTTPLASTKIYDGTVSSTMTQAHKQDILHRRVNYQTGEVYRDYGKTYFHK